MASRKAAQTEELDLDEALAAAWDEKNPDDPLDKPEPKAKSEPVEEPEDAPTTLEEPEEEPEEELPEPHQHWSKADKEIFNTMNAAQRSQWIERERTFEQGFQQRAGELNSSRQAINEFQGMISPLVEDWQRQGLAPSQGLMRLVALEKDLRSDPASALMRMARDYGVDIEKTYGEQPYIDPQTRAVQDQQQQLQQRIENFERQQAQQRHDQAQQQSDAAARAVQTFAQQTDDSGELLYPYVADKTVMEGMGRAISEGRAIDLPSAYSAAMDELKSHPFFRDHLASQSVDKTKSVSRAKAASKVVRGEAKTQDADYDATLNQLLDEAGYT